MLLKKEKVKNLELTGLFICFKPLALVRPADTQQVSEVVKLANAEKMV